MYDYYTTEWQNHPTHIHNFNFCISFLYYFLVRVVNALKKSRLSADFLHPVSQSRYPDYYEKIENPMCIDEIVRRIENSATDHEPGSSRVS